jgi:hypothetical protein
VAGTTLLTKGSEHPLHPLSNKHRLADIGANLLRGNHQSAKAHAKQILDMMTSEVENGWQLILPWLAIFLLPGAILAPMGLVTQETITERGEIIPKSRLTHDQSFNPIPKTVRSVHDCVRWEDLTPCQYGSALIHFIHIIVAFRTLYPRECILLTKVDWKSAYRRMH